MMHTGQVTRWFDNRGFGFIRPDDGGADVFVHISNIRSSNLSVDHAVEFDTEISERTQKPQAINVMQVRN